MERIPALDKIARARPRRFGRGGAERLVGRRDHRESPRHVREHRDGTERVAEEMGFSPGAKPEQKADDAERGLDQRAALQRDLPAGELRAVVERAERMGLDQVYIKRRAGIEGGDSEGENADKHHGAAFRRFAASSTMLVSANFSTSISMLRKPDAFWVSRLLCSALRFGMLLGSR